MSAGLLDRTVGLSAALRRVGVPVSLAESLDAVRAMGVVGLGERELLRAALAAAMVKRAGHGSVFDVLFDVWFPAVTGEPVLAGSMRSTAAAGDPAALPAAGEPGAGDAWRRRLADLLVQGEDRALRRFAQQAVGALGRAESAPGRQSHFAYRVLRALSPDTLTAEAIAALLDSAGTGRSAFTEEVARREIELRLRAFRQYVDAEVRRRLAAERPPDQLPPAAIAPLVEQVDFLRASRADLAELSRQVHPLARRLATRLSARRRVARNGRLDMRRTIRASLATGGVPVDPVHRPRRAHKPELVILCDMSGSVASFAHFTLMLTWALHEQFAKVRVFAFIDALDEVTHLLRGADDMSEALGRMSREADLVWLDGHSDYGHALEMLDDRYARAITAKTSLLVLGDARTNYRSPATPVLKAMVAAARHAYWLNPEPAAQWGGGDSAALTYAQVIEMVECRTVTQLEDFAGRLLAA